MVRWTAIWSLVLASTALAQASYTNPRYGYRIDVPPGFNLSQESDNGDGRTYIAAEGRASLAVWANYLSGSDFETEMAERIADRTRGGGASPTSGPRQAG
ncbi:hypothetical protein LXM94_11060 [Rhizobium sp. TRM95111]|uniref:hypothetical protein n=1 Tax=Rhizobium alarense TaxID=2846851 RepID=UPI001F198C29|nr:hypothetical protein [Rhizobium alarense]MCF3640502.1 hypothetical protein [Rhizobium alarense]